jgi:GTPase SAR1 family protein
VTSGAHGFFLVFDVGNLDSFENIEAWLVDVQRYSTSETPKILLGNKQDTERKIPIERIQVFIFLSLCFIKLFIRKSSHSFSSV